MIELSTIRDLVAIFGVIAGFSYYVLTVRNAQRNQKQQLETRQAQLLMNIMNTFRSREFRSQWHIIFELIQMEIDFDAFRENIQKDIESRTAWTSVLAFFESVGVLVRNGMIEVGLIYSLMGLSVKALWEGLEHLIIGDRENLKQYTKTPENYGAWDDFEYLYHEIISYEKTSTNR